MYFHLQDPARKAALTVRGPGALTTAQHYRFCICKSGGVKRYLEYTKNLHESGGWSCRLSYLFTLGLIV